MNNFLTQGYDIMRADGTRETYWGWSIDEIKALEASRHGYTGTINVMGKVYEIENELHRYTYNEKTGTFRDYNEPADDITELETDYGIAGYLWELANEADEESVRAYKFMAIDIFGTFDRWRAMAFMRVMKEFENDVQYLQEVTR